MPETGLPSVTKKIDDDSDEKIFQFTFYCDLCGTKYRSESIAFSVQDAPCKFNNFTNAQKLIWGSEHEDAYERANQCALLVFTRCRICGDTFCEDCAADCGDSICAACAKEEKKMK